MHADLTVGASVGSAQRLAANMGLCFQGMNLVGKGFRLNASQVRSLGYDPAALPDVVKPYCNARDFMQGGEHGFVIDLFGLSADEAMREHPALYQWLLDRVKPERDLNNRDSRRRNWWLFGEPVGRLRIAWKGLRRVILTPETSKHRVFAFQVRPFCPDHTLYAMCSDDAFVLGVLSAQVHATWALRAGGTLEDRPRWNSTATYLPYPFPDQDTGLSSELRARIADLAERIDGHRKTVHLTHAAVTLTGLYNVLEKLRSGEPLNAKDKLIHEHGLVGVLRTLHDELDSAVLAAYQWADLIQPPNADATARAAADDTLLERLVALNQRRAAEEASGTVRWLRPEFQQKSQGSEQASLDIATEQPQSGDEGLPAPTAALGAAAVPKRPWPAGLPGQIKAVAEVLSAAVRPLTLADVEARFTARGRWRDRLPIILDTLEALGRARVVGGDTKAWQGR